MPKNITEIITKALLNCTSIGDEPRQPGIGAVNPTNITTLDPWVNEKSKAMGANLIGYIFEGSMTSAFDYQCS
jgi:hypothetical protein